jgi:Rrf2 family protein
VRTLLAYLVSFSGKVDPMRVTAKADYAVRAVIEIGAGGEDGWVTAETIAERHAIPRPFLIKILQQLRTSGLTEAVRGPDGGHRLARPADRISIADVVRAIDGPLADVHGVEAEELGLTGSAAPMVAVWGQLRRSVDDLLEGVSIADVLADNVSFDGARHRRVSAS